jgi:hypothetical protein
VATDERIRVVLAEHSPAWTQLFRNEEQRIRAILGRVAVVVEHVGSTAVPGLPAKPVVDVCLGVPDPRDEPRYRTKLTRIGYRLRIREPEWFDHRLLVLPEPAVNLHVFAVGCPEITRMIRFRTGSAPTQRTGSATPPRKRRWPGTVGRRCRTMPTPRPAPSARYSPPPKQTTPDPSRASLPGQRRAGRDQPSLLGSRR